jgi:Glycine cleavage H-protein
VSQSLYIVVVMEAVLSLVRGTSAEIQTRQISGLTAPPDVIERSFSLHYGVGCARQSSDKDAPLPPASSGEDVAIARHKNGICVVCLSPSHPVVRRKLQVTAVSFRSGLVRPVQGKRKRGGAILEPRSRLASVLCSTGENFLVSACVKGVLVEVNTALERNPGLVATKPLTNGYLAVILPSRNDLDRATAKLLDTDPAAGAAT